MRYTQNFNLKKPEGSDNVDVNDFNENADVIDEEISKKATQTEDGRMSKEDKSKLDGIDGNANNYVHPASHPPSIIDQDAGNRFFTDTERTKLSNIESGAQVNEVSGSEFSSLQQGFDTHSDDGTIHFQKSDVSKSDVGLSNVDNIKQEPSFSKNTAFNKDFGTTAGTVAEGNHTHPEYDNVVSGSYTGDGGSNRDFVVGFTPSIVIIAGEGSVGFISVEEDNSDDTQGLYNGSVLEAPADRACIIENGFHIGYQNDATNLFNRSNDIYKWVAFK